MGCFVAVPQDRVVIIEKFGKFNRVAQPGLTIFPFPGIWYELMCISILKTNLL